LGYLDQIRTLEKLILIANPLEIVRSTSLDMYECYFGHAPFDGLLSEKSYPQHYAIVLQARTKDVSNRFLYIQKMEEGGTMGMKLGWGPSPKIGTDYELLYETALATPGAITTVPEPSTIVDLERLWGRRRHRPARPVIERAANVPKLYDMPGAGLPVPYDTNLPVTAHLSKRRKKHKRPQAPLSLEPKRPVDNTAAALASLRALILEAHKYRYSLYKSNCQNAAGGILQAMADQGFFAVPFDQNLYVQCPMKLTNNYGQLFDYCDLCRNPRPTVQRPVTRGKRGARRPITA